MATLIFCLLQNSLVHCDIGVFKKFPLGAGAIVFCCSRISFGGVPRTPGRAELRSQPSQKQHLVAFTWLCSYCGTKAHAQSLAGVSAAIAHPKCNTLLVLLAGLSVKSKQVC